MAPKTLDELRTELATLPWDHAIGVPYDVFALLFPPGEPDERARESAYKFAQENGCTISNHQAEKIVFFIKSK
jgi:hypothetical protein